MWFRLQKNESHALKSQLTFGVPVQLPQTRENPCRNHKLKIRFLSPYTDYYVLILRVNPLNQLNIGKMLLTCLKLKSFLNYFHVL